MSNVKSASLVLCSNQAEGQDPNVPLVVCPNKELIQLHDMDFYSHSLCIMRYYMRCIALTDRSLSCGAVTVKF